MPRVTGLELARDISPIRAGTPVILYTGYGDDIPRAELAAANVHTLARKPVDPAELFALLRTSLQQTPNHREIPGDGAFVACPPPFQRGSPGRVQGISSGAQTAPPGHFAVLCVCFSE